jgi:excisionase family DNA binding protein
MGISNLKTHSASYVTVAELADYWEVTRQLVYKHIQTGLLPAMRLGPRCFRVRTEDAIDFERLLSSKSSSIPRSHGERASSIQLVRQPRRDSLLPD